MAKNDRIRRAFESLFSLAKSEATLKDVWKLFIMSLSDGTIGVRASAITLNLFLAFFPLLIVILTLTPFIPIDHFQDRVLGVIMEVFSDDITTYLQSTIDDIVSIPHGGMMSFGFMGAIIFATNGIAMMLMAFEASAHVKQRRNWFKNRFFAFGLLIVLIILFTVAIGSFVAGELVIKKMSISGVLDTDSSFFWIKTAKWFFTVISVLLAFSVLYFVAPHRGSYRFFSQGSIFSTLGVFLLTWALKSYFAQFNQYNILYGSIGSLIFMIMWIYFISFVILFGFEINMSIMSAKLEDRRHKTKLLEN
ncbi:MAG: YihY/virulence factor BrkB family protein [Bacteroidales bacterium]|jgi:membrane protein|nr:YihY/virulence factor BrkB family protein [Bacteroidales bacterium]